MLYTVRPLEQIYATPKRNEKEPKKNKELDEENEFQEVLLPHGRIVAKRDGENYVVQKVNSTNMSDYLNEEYSPGKMINKR